jgi:hypothetical protein
MVVVPGDVELLNIDNTSEKSFVALCYSNKTLGISCYNELLNTIYTNFVTVSSLDINDILINLKIKLSPTLFIIHPTLISNQDLLDLILCSSDGAHKNYYKYKSLKSSCWNPETSMELICSKLYVKKLHQSFQMNRNITTNVYQQQQQQPQQLHSQPLFHNRDLHIPTVSVTMTSASIASSSRDNNINNNPSLNIHHNYFLISSVIDIDNNQLKSSLGALLTFMSTNLFQLDNGKIHVADLQLLKLSDYLKLDDMTYNALQIFTQDIHPNVIKECSKNKEGFSLFTLFDRTRSLLGRQILKNWMKQPFNNLEKINNRLDAIDLVTDPDNRELVNNVVKLLRRIGNADINRYIDYVLRYLRIHTTNSLYI